MTLKKQNHPRIRLHRLYMWWFSLLFFAVSLKKRWRMLKALIYLLGEKLVCIFKTEKKSLLFYFQIRTLKNLVSNMSFGFANSFENVKEHGHQYIRRKPHTWIAYIWVFCYFFVYILFLLGCRMIKYYCKTFSLKISASHFFASHIQL